MIASLRDAIFGCLESFYLHLLPLLASMQVMSYHIEHNEYGGFSVYELGVYPRSSVLAGQTRKTFVDAFDTLEQAQAAHPRADVGGADVFNTFDHLCDDVDDMEAYERDCLRDELYYV